MSKNWTCRFTHTATVLSEKDKVFYNKEINSAETLYAENNLQGAKEKLRSLWKKYPYELEAYKRHLPMITCHTQFPFWLNEFGELRDSMEKHIPHELHIDDEEFSKELEKLTAPSNPTSFSAKR